MALAATIAIAGHPHFGLRRIGLTLSPAAGSLKAAAIVAAAYCGFFVVIAMLFPADPPSTEDVAFQTTMPGLDEELFYRGLLLFALDQAFRGRKQLLGVDWGWGAVLSCLLFGMTHAFGYSDGAFAFDPLPWRSPPFLPSSRYGCACAPADCCSPLCCAISATRFTSSSEVKRQPRLDRAWVSLESLGVTTNSFSVRGGGRQRVTAVKACSALSFARHSHDEYGVGLMLAGAQRSWSGRGHVEAFAGDLITVNPGEVHDGMAIGDSRKWAMLYLDTDKVSAIAADIHEGKRSETEFTRPVLQNVVAAHRFAAAYAAHERGNEDAMDEQLILLLAGMLGDPRTSRARAPQSIDQVKERIDADPAADHPLDELAQISGTSRFKTLRGFAALTGLTPHAYIIQRRLDLAKALIRSGVGLAQAGSEAGFADQSHFHRTFVRRFGMTPGAYAAAMR